MAPNYIYTKPSEIEARSMQLIEQELGPHSFTDLQLPIVKRVIHTSADFEYKNSLYFSQDAVENALSVLKAGTTIITDTNMALSGINKPALHKLNIEAHCFMAEPAIVEAAALHGTTRAAAAMTHASSLPGSLIFAVGNAPTALIRINELMRQSAFRPALVIGVPVGFVNVTESKQELIDTAADYNVPVIVARGRKGGSNVAAAICNALLYMASGRTL